MRKISNRRIKEIIADDANGSIDELESLLTEVLRYREILKFKAFTTKQTPEHKASIEIKNKETGFISRAIYQNFLSWDDYAWRYPIDEVIL